MENLIRIAKEKIREREQLIAQLENEIKSAPEGSLRASCSHGRIQYYHRCKEQRRYGVYIKSSDQELARELARKQYDMQLIESAEYELRHLYPVRDLQPHLLEDIYLNMPDPFKSLIDPIWISDDEYADRWQSVTYPRKPIDDDIPEYITNRDERVRSKSEILEANTMDRLGIPYHYEKPLRLQDGRVIHPDFTVLRKKTREVLYLEHFGKMGDPDYVNRCMLRLNWYMDSGIYPGDRLFITFETKEMPLHMRRLEELLRAWFL